MNGEAVKEIERIAREATEPKAQEVNGHWYAARQLFPLLPPAVPSPGALVVHTLSGLVDYIVSNVDSLAGRAIHVRSHESVALVSPLVTPQQQRHVYVEAKFKPLFDTEASAGFAFGRYLDMESFLIALQTLFEDAEDRAKVLKVLGTVKEEKVRNTSDDGVTQTVNARTGVALVAEVPVPNPVTLRPFRTFRDIWQPSSVFVLRLRSGAEGGQPQAGLWEADGGGWKVIAIEAIKHYLSDKLAAVKVPIFA